VERAVQIQARDPPKPTGGAAVLENVVFEENALRI